MEKILFTSPAFCNLDHSVGIDSIAAISMTEALPSVLANQEILPDHSILLDLVCGESLLESGTIVSSLFYRRSRLQPATSKHICRGEDVTRLS
ncbi:hypothetical protein TNIN_98291 [Trichonephila inaurata madagascariensis]|uniref:Uncharacterized protein n=1 Tax=Trichonephila inaurata madagascariensis TaxID=2747483 RepID=A0A8X6XQQ3_9ARAC|nr:hypothetical protein TNIN_98291 [Trichonephila inaurata madagascariensis]